MPPTRQGSGGSPYAAGGRRATDDLFASSSLLDQNQLPDWLARRPERQPGFPTPPTSGAPPARPAFGSASRPDALQARGDPEADLPTWLRALEPGAPPPPAPPIARLSSGSSAGGSLTNGPLRSSPGGSYPSGSSGGSYPPAPNRSSALEWPDALGSTPPGGDPLSASSLGRPFPSSSTLSEPDSQRNPFTALPDPFAARSPLGQMPRQTDPFAGISGGQPIPPAMPQWDIGKAPGASRSESRAADLSARSTDRLSPGSLVDEEALPEWLRTKSPGGSAIQGPSLPRSMPAPSAFGGARIDTGALRSPASPAAGASAPPPPTSPFDGAALVDEAALPDWLRSSSQTEPLPLPFSVAGSIGTRGVTSETARKQPAEPAPRGGADDEELPEWLRQVYVEARVPPLSQGQPLAGREPASKLSAAELVDEQVMPDWIREATQTSPLPNLDDVLSAPPLSAGQPGLAARAGKTAEVPSSSSAPGSGWLEGNALLDESSLPEWLRNTGGPASAPPGASVPSAPTRSAAQQPTGSASGIFSAAELVDTQALPAWLKAQEPKTAADQPANTLGENRSAGSVSGIFSAAELVDTRDLPVWLKAQEPKTAVDQPANTLGENRSVGSVSGIFSAAELVDTRDLPAWLKGQDQSAAAGAPAAVAPDARQAPPARPAASSKIGPMPVGFSAAELVDTQDLPVWIKGATGAVPTVPSESSQARQSNQEGNAERRMSGSDLIDTRDLPTWLKGSESSGASLGALPGTPAEGGSFSDRAAGSGVFPAASLVDPDALPAWLWPAQTGEGAPPVRQSSPLAGAPERNAFERSGLSGASLIDEQQLPDWMHSPGGLDRPGGMPGSEAALDEGLHARVPRRPHLSNELDRAPSQAAASVFSSVLGPVAGEEQQDQPQARPTPRQREMPPGERIGAPGQSASQRQSAEWEGAGLGGRAQPPPSMPRGAGQPFQPPRGAFEDEAGRNFEPGAPDGFGGWPGDNGGQSTPKAAWPGRLPGTQRGRQMPPDEPEELSGPPNRRTGRTVIGPDQGMAGGREQERYGGPEYDEYAPDPQWRGQPPQFGYQAEGDEWEGGPGYDPNFQGDEEAGPPSGVFAKLKRMLGFGR